MFFHLAFCVACTCQSGDVTGSAPDLAGDYGGVAYLVHHDLNDLMISTTLDESGAFRFEDVAPGTIRLAARSECYETGMITLENCGGIEGVELEVAAVECPGW